MCNVSPHLHRTTWVVQIYTTQASHTQSLFHQNNPDAQRKTPVTQKQIIYSAPPGRKIFRDQSGGACVSYLNVLEHVWMVANFPQLHDRVHQGLCATFTLEDLKGGKNPHYQNIWIYELIMCYKLQKKFNQWKLCYLLVLFWPICEQDALGLHVSVQNPL